MASGFSRRMNRNKLLLSLGEETILERVIKAAKNSSLDEIILVYNNEDVKKIAEKHGVTTVYNENPDKGQSESMKLGIINANKKTKGYMFIVGDQPFLNSNTINTIINTFKHGNKYIVVPMYNNKRGNPTIFTSELKEALLDVEGDKGGRGVIKEYQGQVVFVPIDDYKLGLDIDTWEEYQKIMNGDVEVD